MGAEAPLLTMLREIALLSRATPGVENHPALLDRPLRNEGNWLKRFSGGR
jgi:hypothetical protein